MSARILHITNDLSYSGVTSYIVRVIQALPNSNHSILSCYNGSANKEIKDLNIIFRILLNKTKIKFRYLPLKYWKFIEFIVKNRFDIIHYHQGGVGVLFLAWLLKKKAVIIHHIYAANLIGDHSKQEISIFHTFLLRFLSSRIVIVVVAKHILLNYKRTINNDNASIVISNSVPYNFAPKEKIGNKIGYIGRITMRKGFNEFVNMSTIYKKKTDKIKFIAQGDFDKSFKDISKHPNILLSNATFKIDDFYRKIDLLFFYLARRKVYH